MFTLACEKCGHEWVAPLTEGCRCPNCLSMTPFQTYKIPKPLAPSIYHAPFSERLADLGAAVRMAQNMVEHPDMTRPYVGAPEGLKEGEFAIGNWIVRPRF